MSDVEKRIEQWRASLTDSQVLSRADVQEMESHLREEITHLEASGLAGDEAFIIARRRLGDPAALEEEFAKVYPHRGLVHRLCWAIAGVLLYLAAAELGRAMSSLFLALGNLAGLQPGVLGAVGGLITLAAFTGSIILALWLYQHHVHRHDHAHPRNSLVAPLLGVAVLVLGVWLFCVADRLLTVVFLRTVGPAQFGMAVRAEGYIREVWHLLLPLLLAGVLLVLYLRHRREAPVE